MSDNTPSGVPPQPNEPAGPAQPTPPPVPPTPPAGGYAAPPPPPGGYAPPPPPPGGYAAPPPGGYAAPAPSSGGADLVMDGVKYGWKKFTQNVGPFIAGGAIWLIGFGIIAGILYGVLIVGTIAAGDSGASQVGFSFGWALMVGIIALLAVFIQAAFLNAALRVAAGQVLTVNDFFKLPNMGAALGTAIIVGIASAIGYALFTLPGIAITIFTMFAIVIALDKGLGPVDAIKASIDMVKNNFVPVLLLALAVYVISAIGGAICGIGLLAAYPIAYLAVVYVYRKLQFQNVAA